MGIDCLHAGYMAWAYPYTGHDFPEELVSLNMKISENKRQGILLGMLVGDALGVPYEFHDAAELPGLDGLEFEPPVGFPRAHRGVPAGTWSDDGALALALLDSLQSHPRLDLQDLGERMLAWRDQGRYTPDGRVFDIGIQTSTSLSKLAKGTSALLSGGAEAHQNGNGSLMRTLSCLLVPLPPLPAEGETWEELLISRAMLQGTPTHAHPRSSVCCALATSVGAQLAIGLEPPQAFRAAKEAVEAFVSGTGAQEELDVVLGAQHEGSITGSGYVVESWWSAWWALYTSTNYEECVKKAVALGNDTDTTACIAGGLAGARWGVEAIPPRWLEHLNGRDLALSFLNPLKR